MAKSETPTRLEPLLTVAQAADHCNLSQRQVRRYVADGSLKVVRFGRSVRIGRDVLAAFIKERGS